MEDSAILDLMQQVKALGCAVSADLPLTQNNHFCRDVTGTLLDRQGKPVLDYCNKPIVVGDDDFSVMPDGTVSTPSLGVIARIKPVRLDFQSTGVAVENVVSNEPPPTCIDYPYWSELATESDHRQMAQKGQMPNLNVVSIGRWLRTMF